MDHRTRVVAFFAYVVCVAIGNWHILRALVDHALDDESASHVVLIPFVTLALIYQGRRSIFSRADTTGHFSLHALLIGIAVAVTTSLYLLPTDRAALSLSVAAVMALWLAGFVVFFGTRSARAAAFPLIFLLFTIPIPPPILDAATWILKTGSTEAVAALFTLTRTPHLRDGFLFELPTVAIEVADACSGIRSSIALVLTSLLAGHQYLDSAWKNVVLVLAVIPITILKNGIRIVSLSLLAIHVDPGFLTGQLHNDGGILFFLVALALLLPILTMLRHAERPIGC